MCFASQRRKLFKHLSFQKCSETGVFCTFWLRNVLRATTACTFSTLQLPKVVRRQCFVHFDLEQRRALFRHLNLQKWSEPGVFCHFDVECALRRTRCFSEPTFRPSGATNHWKNTVFRDFPTFSRTLIFFLMRLSFFWYSFFFSSLLWLFPSLLFICPYCRKFDF